MFVKRSIFLLLSLILVDRIRGFLTGSKGPSFHLPIVASYPPQTVFDRPKHVIKTLELSLDETRENVSQKKLHPALHSRNDARVQPLSLAKKSIGGTQGKSGSNKDKKSDDANDNMAKFKKNPGTIIIAPFILLFGLDLVLNIAVITKRSLEVLFTGEYTVWTPWQ